MIDELYAQVRQDLQRGDLESAEKKLRQMLVLRPDYGDALGDLGMVLVALGQQEQALPVLDRALPHLAGSPGKQAVIYANLGVLHRVLGRLDEAEHCYRLALTQVPQLAMVWNNLAEMCFMGGRLQEALTHLRNALQLDPHNLMFASNRIFFHEYCSGTDTRELKAALTQWQRTFADPLKKTIRAPGNERSSNRRLKVGYVSPNLGAHPVGRFLLPLLKAHDAHAVETFCYTDVGEGDRITRELKATCAHWRMTNGLSDAQVAEMVRTDRIDILVDLSMHMGGNRLLVFARKPAPVQVTYLAYASTTGLETMDYRLTDPYLDPPGTDMGLYSEKSAWLPRYWCYGAMAEAPDVNEPPALQNRAVTFGCLNAFHKMSPEALETWGTLLTKVPESRLLLHASQGSHREQVWRKLEERGVARTRCSFVGSAGLADYFHTYQRIDVALDPFPYAGGTTTCDALWMGVPVVTLRGPRAVGRGGVSILSSLGAPQWIAQTREEYVRLAAELAADVERLAAWRRTLRVRLQESPLMDATRFARSIEDAFRQMWRTWCQQ